MGWETVKGNRYYYRKKRIGNKVVSIYLGKGKAARKAAREVEKRRTQRIRRKEQRECEDIHTPLRDLMTDLNALLNRTGHRVSKRGRLLDWPCKSSCTAETGETPKPSKNAPK